MLTHEATHTITVRGSRLSVELPAIIDTGFDGFLLLPMDVASHIGAVVSGWSEIVVADGSLKKVAAVNCEVNLLGRAIRVRAYITELTDLVVGTKLLAGCRLKIDGDSGAIELKRKRT